MAGYYWTEQGEEIESKNSNNINNTEEIISDEEIRRPEVDVEDGDVSNGLRNLVEENEFEDNNNFPDTFEDHLKLIKPGLKSKFGIHLVMQGMPYNHFRIKN